MILDFKQNEINKVSLSEEEICTVRGMLGPKTAADIMSAMERFNSDPVNGLAFSQMSFARGVIWACYALKAKTIAAKMAKTDHRSEGISNEISVTEESFEDDRIVEIYRGMEYRYTQKDIGPNMGGLSYVNGTDEEGKEVVLKLKDGAICGATPGRR